MTTPQPPSVDEITETVDVVSSWLDNIHTIINSGATVDLSGLEKQVAAICAAVHVLPPAQGVSIRPILESLLTRIDTVRQDLHATRPPLTETTDNIINAYQDSAALFPPK